MNAKHVHSLQGGWCPECGAIWHDTGHPLVSERHGGLLAATPLWENVDGSLEPVERPNFIIRLWRRLRDGR